MNRLAKMFALTLVAGLVLGCEARTEEVDAGGVILSITDFDGLPLAVSATGDFELMQIGSITVENIAKNSNLPTSSLMNVEIHSYEVRYRREDSGTRVPPVLVQSIFGVAPVNGTFILENGPFMRPSQFDHQPLSDLRDFGRDLETGSRVVQMQVSLQFFGKTLSGDEVASAPGYFSIDVVP